MPVLGTPPEYALQYSCSLVESSLLRRYVPSQGYRNFPFILSPSSHLVTEKPIQPFGWLPAIPSSHAGSSKGGLKQQNIPHACKQKEEGKQNSGQPYNIRV